MWGGVERCLFPPGIHGVSPPLCQESDDMPGDTPPMENYAHKSTKTAFLAVGPSSPYVDPWKPAKRFAVRNWTFRCDVTRCHDIGVFLVFKSDLCLMDQPGLSAPGILPPPGPKGGMPSLVIRGGLALGIWGFESYGKVYCVRSRKTVLS